MDRKPRVNRNLNNSGIRKKEITKKPYINMTVRLDEDWLQIIMDNSVDGNISQWVRSAIKEKLAKIN